MAASRISSGTAGGSSSTASPFTGAIGCSVQVGDLIVVVANSNGTRVALGMGMSDPNNGSYTTLDDTQQGNASTKWMQTFYKIATASMTSTDLITMTPYAAATAASFVVDVFRNVTALNLGPTKFSGPSATSASTPALPSAPPVDALVLSLTTISSGTASPPFTYIPGASGKTPTCSVAYVLGADGVSTYGDTWSWGATSSSALQTVSFSTTTAAPIQTGSANSDGTADLWDFSGQLSTDGTF